MTFCAFGEKISEIFLGAHEPLDNPQSIAMKAVNGSRFETHLFGNGVPGFEPKVPQFQKRPVLRLSNLRDQFPNVSFQIDQLVNLRMKASSP